ncbi:hypothetical protein ACQJBY_064598 [Aegilops geniculata]
MWYLHRHYSSRPQEEISSQVQRRFLTSSAITTTSCKFAAENKHDHLKSPVVALAALGHELVHHGYSQPSKWSTDISPSRIEATIFTKLCTAVQVEHTEQYKALESYEKFDSDFIVIRTKACEVLHREDGLSEILQGERHNQAL